MSYKLYIVIEIRHRQYVATYLESAGPVSPVVVHQVRSTRQWPLPSRGGLLLTHVARVTGPSAWTRARPSTRRVESAGFAAAPLPGPSIPPATQQSDDVDDTLHKSTCCYSTRIEVDALGSNFLGHM